MICKSSAKYTDPMQPISHADACRLAMLELSRLGCRHVVQRTVGLFRDERGTPRRIGEPGEADVQAVAPGGRAVAVEIKTGNAHRTAQQKRWGDSFVRSGGLYCVARFNSASDGLETIRNAFRLAGYTEVRNYA